MKLSSPVFFPCKKPHYNAKLAYRQVSKDQMVNLLLIVPRYNANQLYHTSMILQVGLQAINVN
jgi:hypothetical protein